MAKKRTPKKPRRPVAPPAKRRGPRASNRAVTEPPKRRGGAAKGRKADRRGLGASGLMRLGAEREAVRSEVAHDRAARYAEYVRQLRAPTEPPAGTRRALVAASAPPQRRLRILAEGDSWFEYPIRGLVFSDAADGVKGQSWRTDGRPSLSGPGRLESVTLNPYRQGRRMQESIFDLAGALTKAYVNSGQCEAPPHVLFREKRWVSIATPVDTELLTGCLC